jgi:uncharacterized protein
MNLNDLEKMTVESGESWGISHVRRVLGLIDMIGEGLAYRREALQYAVYLHDWGAFPHYHRAGVDHALRSKQIAEEILPQTDLSVDAIPAVLEAIELHDYRCTRPVRSTEALVLREADWLDMLGAIGIAREFAWGPNNLAQCCERVRSRMHGIAGRFTLPKAQAIAEARLVEMQHFLEALEQESLGHL